MEIRSQQILSWLFFFGMALLIAALPLSKFLMSVSQFILAGVFILDGIRRERVVAFYRENSTTKAALLTIPYGIGWIGGSLRRKFRRFFASDNMPAIVFSSLFLLHVVGLWNTVNFDYAIKDLRIKFPLFLLPLVLSTTGKLSRERFRYLIGIFVAAVFVATLISTYHFVTGNYNDIREISKFISHIRFSLLICIAIFMLGYWLMKRNSFTPWQRVLILGLMAWFIGYLLVASSITGLAVLVSSFLILSIVLIIHSRRNLVLRIGAVTLLIAIPVFLLYYLISVINDVYTIHPVDLDKLDRTTELGNPYWHNFEDEQVENGYYVWLYVATDELREAWNERSAYDFDGLDKKGQEIKYTLIRFLSSKGFRKDAKGLSKLTDEEVELIENGVASIVYQEKPLIYVRIYKIIWEYQRYQTTGNASGHSVMQRFVFWNTAIQIIKDNLYTGVGTGDLDQAYEEQYKKMDSLLDEQFRRRSHNQFLAMAVAFGIFGLAWFLFAFLYPPISNHRFTDYYYLTFFLVMALSMFTEDTLESQAGVTIYAFFSSLYLFAKKFHDPV
jgi:hypothetical protein